MSAGARPSRTVPLLVLLALAMAASGGRAQADGERIFLSTTSSGLPSYSHQPERKDDEPYLTLTQPPPRPRQHLSLPTLRPRAPSPSAYSDLVSPTVRQLVTAASRAYGVPEALLLAVMQAESNFNPKARSPVGAIGLMQIMPPTGARYGVRHDLADPVKNIDVGARYLKDLLELFKGNVQLAVAAYNAGEGAVIRHGRRIPPYKETQAYVPKVLSLYARYTEQLAAGSDENDEDRAAVLGSAEPALAPVR